jgi:hypothetical protein
VQLPSYGTDLSVLWLNRPAARQSIENRILIYSRHGHEKEVVSLKEQLEKTTAAADT